MRRSSANRAAAIAVSLVAAFVGCGDAGGSAGGEPCDAPGTTRLCTCAVAELGRQECLETMYWGDCDCPGSPSTACVPGGPSPCAGCPDAPAVCNDRGGFDCSCGATGSDGGNDPGTDGGPTPADSGGADAATDASASDAALGDDAGGDDAG